MSEEEQSSEARIKQVMKDFHTRLQEAGLKSTRQRDTIVRAFFEIDKHITADELLEEVRELQPRIGYATVYRTLKLLVEQGFALPKDFGDGITRYDPIHDQDPHHDHLICVNCRKIIEFDDDEVAELLAKIAARYGMEMRRKKLEIYAECRVGGCSGK